MLPLALLFFCFSFVRSWRKSFDDLLSNQSSLILLLVLIRFTLNLTEEIHQKHSQNHLDDGQHGDFVVRSRRFKVTGVDPSRGLPWWRHHVLYTLLWVFSTSSGFLLAMPAGWTKNSSGFNRDVQGADPTDIPCPKSQFHQLRVSTPMVMLSSASRSTKYPTRADPAAGGELTWR